MKTNLRSFAGGEITPELYGRLDLTKFQTGLSLCRNFVVLPHGPIARRPGTKYVLHAGIPTGGGFKKVRLVPFTFSQDQTMVLEFGHLYVRFHTGGQTLLEAAQSITSIAGDTITKAAHGYFANEYIFVYTAATGAGAFFKVFTKTLGTLTMQNLDGSVAAPVGDTMARAYTLTSPYTEDMLFDLRFAQSNDVVTIASDALAMRELRRVGATNWQFRTVSFSPTLLAPTGVTATATSPGGLVGAVEQRYVVTSIGLDNVTESVASGQGGVSTTTTVVSGTDPDTGLSVTETITTWVGNNVTNALNIAGNYNTVTWTNTGDAVSYNVYKLRGGVYGFIGSAVDGTIGVKDDNILPDTTKTPPTDTIKLNDAAGNYPQAVALYEQRRWMGGTTNAPNTVWGTRSGTQSNLTSSVPSQDDDGLQFRVAANQQNAIKHLVPLNDLLALTGGSLYRLYAPNAPVITPTSINIKQQSGIGSSDVAPVVANRAALFVQATGSRVREVYEGGPDTNYGYKLNDTTLMAPHLFNGYTIVDMAYTAEPDKTVWCVRSDGALLGLTYVPDQQVYAWHQHITDGLVESVCAVSENNVDVLYLLVKRTMTAGTFRIIERMQPRLFTDAVDAYFVDCGLTYDGTPATTISGLTHLNGKTVDVLADGAVVPDKVVTGGAITLDTAASVVHIGLPYTSDMTTLPLAMEAAPAQGQGTNKNVNEVFVRVTQSSLIQAGPSFTKLRSYPARAVSDPYGSPPALRTGELRLKIDPTWGSDGAVCMRQDQPLPLTVLSLALDVATGG